MSLLDEQMVEEWLNRNDFFTMRGLKCGIDEIDLLAIRHRQPNEFWHVEVQVSFRPIGYVGGDTNARKRTSNEIRDGIEKWVFKKFKNEKKSARREQVAPGANWKYKFVHGNLRDAAELEYMSALGVEPVAYTDVLSGLLLKELAPSSSIASGIVEIIKFASYPSG